MMKIKFSLGKGLKMLILGVFTIIQVYPLIWLVMFSLKDNGEIFGGNVLGFPHKFLWDNYIQAFSAAKVGVYFVNSVVVTGATILITIFVSCLAAYTIARMRWSLSAFALIFFTMGMMIPVHAALLPLFLALRKVSLLNTPFALIIPYVGFAIPLAINILANFFKSIPQELEESAFMDGANIYRTFFSIMLPMVRPAIYTVAILTYVSTWNELMFATAFVNKQAYKTLTVGIMSMVGQYVTKWGPIGAGLVIATLPSIIGFVLVSKELPKSISAGAVKG